MTPFRCPVAMSVPFWGLADPLPYYYPLVLRLIHVDSYFFSASRPRRGKLATMSDVTHILSAIENGDPSAAEQLLPLVYEELRKLAAQRLAQERPGQTLVATARVREPDRR